jgi:small subunit ribosomal protein S21
MAKVYLRDKEPIERALKRFSVAVAKDGILRELKLRKYYLTENQRRRLKKEEARKRFMKNLKKKLLKEATSNGR